MSLLDSKLELTGDFLFRIGTTSIWLGGMSILCSGLCICYDKRSYSLCLIMLNVELIVVYFSLSIS